MDPIVITGFWPRFVVAMASWTIVFSKYRVFQKARRSNDFGSRSAYHSWMCMLFLALAATYVSEPLRSHGNEAFYRWFGLQNVMVFLEEVASAAAVYHITLFSITIGKTSERYYRNMMRITRGIFISMELFLVGMFVIFIRKTSIVGDIPTNISELIFKGSIYIYSLVLVTYPMRTYISFLRKEENKVTRYRLWLWSIGTLAVSMYLINLTVWIVVGYMGAEVSTLQFLQRFGTFSMLLVIAWAMGFLPSHVLMRITNLTTHIAYLRAYKALEPLYRFLNRIVDSPMKAHSPTIFEVIRHPEFNLYKRIIGILDHQKLLIVSINHSDDPHTHWTKEEVSIVNALGVWLQQVSEDAEVQTDILGLANIYRQLSHLVVNK